MMKITCDCMKLFLCVCILTCVNGKRFTKKAFKEIMKCQTGWREDACQKVELTPAQSQYFDSLGSKTYAQQNEINYQEDSSSPTCGGVTRTRKEYRQMNTKEREDFQRAIKMMKETIIDNSNEYDIFVGLHNRANSPFAHGGSAFLCWHREFLLRFENALRQHVPNAFLPFYASTLDQPLHDITHSVIWGETLLGTYNGEVTTGPFADWRVSENCSRSESRRIVRGAGDFADNTLLIEQADIQRFLIDKGSFSDIYNHRPFDSLETEHGGVHVYIGGENGHMSDLQCSPTDPAFFMHHAFIDCIWEAFRQKQNEQDLTVYGTGTGPGHGPDDPMLPFDGKQNKDGLSIDYTNCNYGCGDVQFECKTDAECNLISADGYLWCNTNLTPQRCMSKIVSGGNCAGLPNKACFGNSQCTRNRCS